MNFLDWVGRKLDDNDWTYDDLARRSGLSVSYISLVLSEKRSLTMNFCTKVARAFGVSEAEALSLAGFISKERGVSYDTEEFTSLFRRLSQDDKEKVISYIRFLLKESR